MAEFPILLTPQFAGDITPGAIQFQPLDFSNLLKTLSTKPATVPKEDRIELPKINALNGATMQANEFFKDRRERQQQITDALGAQGYYSQEYQNINAEIASYLNVETLAGLEAQKNLANENKAKINAHKNGDHIDAYHFLQNPDKNGNHELVTINERYLRENVNAASDYFPIGSDYQGFVFNENLNVDRSLYDTEDAIKGIQEAMAIGDDQFIEEGKLGEVKEKFSTLAGKAIYQTQRLNTFEKSDFKGLTASEEALLGQFKLGNLDSRIYGGLVNSFLQKLRQRKGDKIGQDYFNVEYKLDGNGNVQITKNSQYHDEFVEYANVFFENVVEERLSKREEEKESLKSLSTGAGIKKTSDDIFAQGQTSKVPSQLILNNELKLVPSIDDSVVSRFNDIARLTGTQISSNTFETVLEPGQDQKVTGASESGFYTTFSYDKLQEEASQIKLNLRNEKEQFKFNNDGEEFTVAFNGYFGARQSGNKGINNDEFRNYMMDNHPITLQYMQELESNIANGNIDERTKSYIDSKKTFLENTNRGDSEKLSGLLNIVKGYIKEDAEFLQETMTSITDDAVNRKTVAQGSKENIQRKDFIPSALKEVEEVFVGKKINEAGLNKVHFSPGTIVDPRYSVLGDAKIIKISPYVYHNMDAKAINWNANVEPKIENGQQVLDNNGQPVMETVYGYRNANGTRTTDRVDVAGDNGVYEIFNPTELKALTAFLQANPGVSNAANLSALGMQNVMTLELPKDKFFKFLKKQKRRDAAEEVNTKSEKEWGQRFYSSSNDGGKDIYKAFQPVYLGEEFLPSGLKETNKFGKEIIDGLNDGNIFIVDLNNSSNKQTKTTQASRKTSEGIEYYEIEESTHIDPINGEKMAVLKENGKEVSRKRAYRKSDYQIMSDSDFLEKYGITKSEAEEYYNGLVKHAKVTTLDDLQTKLGTDRTQYQYSDKLNGVGTILSFTKNLDSNENNRFQVYKGTTDAGNVNNALKKQLNDMQFNSGYSTKDKQTFLTFEGVLMDDNFDESTFYTQLLKQMNNPADENAILNDMFSNLNISIIYKDDNDKSVRNIKSVQFNMPVEIKQTISTMVTNQKDLIPNYNFNMSNFSQSSIIDFIGY